MIRRPSAFVFILAAAALARVAGAANAETVEILVTFADAGMAQAAPAGPPGPGYRRRNAQYVVSLDVKRAARRIAEKYRLEAIDEWPIGSLSVHCLVYRAPGDVDIDDLLHRLQAETAVESAQRMNTFHVSTSPGYGSRDPYSGLQHVLDTLELPQAHAWSNGAGSEVTIIDTGADLDHPELAGQISAHRNFTADEPARFSADAHGTAVSGIIAAAYGNGVGMIGVAPAARLKVLKACWYPEDSGEAVCNSFSLARALEFSIQSGSSVINMSLTGPSDALLSRLARIALARGAVVVAASPRAGTAAGFPTEVPGVITVRPSGGQREPVDSAVVNAPGDDIIVPTPAGGYDYASGSSLAAAHVTGVIALMLAAQPGLDHDRIISLLASSQPTVDGSVNACLALAALLERSGCTRHAAASR